MNLTIEEARSMMSSLGQRYQTGEEEDAFLFERDAEQLILEYAVSNGLRLPQVDLAEFEGGDSDARWHETLDGIMKKASEDPGYRNSLPKDFLSLTESFVQSFGWDQ